MNLAFLANKHATMPYADLAAGLERQGHTVFWISPSRRWSAWLDRRGWPAKRVLTLPDLATRWRALSPSDARAALQPLERATGPMIGNVILMDRVVRRLNGDIAHAFLATVADAIRRFMIEFDIASCFGEATWSWEIATWMVCRELGRPCLAFTTVRIPSDRFAFFDSVSHQIVEHRSVERADQAWAAEFLPAYRARPRMPGYARGQPTALAFRAHWLEELWRAALKPAGNRDDLTIWPLRHRMAHRLRCAANAALLRLAPPFARLRDLPEDQRFVLFCLHHQPEASIDVVAALHSDQSAAVARLARLLPASHELWVKEHGNAIGDRSRAALVRLARLPKVRLIDPGESTFALIHRADLVVSPAGTVAYEAALLGAPAATLAPLYFSPLMVAGGDPIAWPLSRILREHRTTPDADLLGFLAWLHAQSFDGLPDRLAGKAMRREPDLENLRAVLAGFEMILGWIRQRAVMPAEAVS